MKKLLVALMLVASGAMVVVADAEAKRMGGGGSIGRQSQSVGRAPAQGAPMQQQAAPKQATPPAAAPGAAAAKPSMWKGLLGGALLGLGLGALFSHLGIGGAMASILSTILTVGLLVLAAVFLYRLFTRNKRQDQQPAFAGGYGSNNSFSRTPEIGSRLEPSAQPSAFSAEPAASAAAMPYGVPADFDVQGFLRHAKTYFIRLQSAWDKAEVNDLREFTTPEMFAELKLQIQERGPQPNVTDVVSINADLLGIEEQNGEYMASVRFEGMIREADHAPTEPFSEIWNLVKPVRGSGGWVLAGIQQLA